MRLDPLKSEKAGMVGWYDPLVFILTGIDNLISNVFGRRSDYRQIQALAPQAGETDQTYVDRRGLARTPAEQLYYDFRFHYRERADGGRRNAYEQDDEGRYLLDQTRERDEVWIDYVADTGDGWDPTYAVAYHLTRPVLNFSERGGERGRRLEAVGPGGGQGATVETRRGDILIFSGDQVYPAANPKSYRARLVAPYESALPAARPQPFLFATPGNHDWFDGLVSFTSLFCARGPFAGWLTRQSRSYFALRLPHQWWFVGVDTQLSADLDAGQLRFFKRLAAQMEEGDHVILGLPEPQWIHTKLHCGYESRYSESSLRDLIDEPIRLPGPRGARAVKGPS